MYKPEKLNWKRKPKSELQIFCDPLPTLEFVVEFVNDEYRCLLPLNDQVSRGINATFKSPEDARVFCYYYWLSEHKRLIKQKIKNLNRLSPFPIDKIHYYQNLLV